MFKKIIIFKINKRYIKKQYGDVEDGTDIFLDEPEISVKKKRSYKIGTREYIKKGKKGFAKFKRYRKKLDFILDYTIRPIFKYFLNPIYHYLIAPFFKFFLNPIYSLLKKYFLIIKKILLDFIVSHWIFLFLKIKILRIYTFFRVQILEIFNFFNSIFSYLNVFCVKYIPFWVLICTIMSFICESIGKIIIDRYQLFFLIYYLFITFFKNIFFWRFILGQNCSQMSTKLWLLLSSLKKAVTFWIIHNNMLYRFLFIFSLRYLLSCGLSDKSTKETPHFKRLFFVFIVFFPVIFFQKFIPLLYSSQNFLLNLVRCISGWFCHEIFWIVSAPILIIIFIWFFYLPKELKNEEKKLETEDEKGEYYVKYIIYVCFILSFRLFHISIPHFTNYIYNFPLLWEYCVFFGGCAFLFTFAGIFFVWLYELVEFIGCFEYTVIDLPGWPPFFISERFVPYRISSTGVASFGHLHEESEDPEFVLGREYTSEELSRMSRYYYRNEKVYPKYIQYEGTVFSSDHFKNVFLIALNELKTSTIRTYKELYLKADSRLKDYEVTLISEYMDTIMNELNFRKKQIVWKHEDLLSPYESRMFFYLEFKLKRLSYERNSNSHILISDIVRQLLNMRTLIIKCREPMLNDLIEISKKLKFKETTGLNEIKSLILNWEQELKKLKNGPPEQFKKNMESNRSKLRQDSVELQDWMEERRTRIFQTNLYKKNNVY